MPDVRRFLDELRRDVCLPSVFLRGLVILALMSEDVVLRATPQTKATLALPLTFAAFLGDLMPEVLGML